MAKKILGDLKMTSPQPTQAEQELARALLLAKRSNSENDINKELLHETKKNFRAQIRTAIIASIITLFCAMIPIFVLFGSSYLNVRDSLTTLSIFKTQSEKDKVECSMRTGSLIEELKKCKEEIEAMNQKLIKHEGMQQQNLDRIKGIEKIIERKLL